MIALTQEKRNSEIDKIKCKIAAIKGDMDIGWTAEEYLLLPLEIALDSLTANKVNAIARHYTGCKYPSIKINSLEFVVCGDRENAEDIAEEISEFYTAPPVPEIKFGTEDDCEDGLNKHGLKTKAEGISQLSDGFRCGFAWREHIIKRLNGLGE